MSKVEVLKLNKYIRIDPHSLLNQGNKYVTNGINNEFFYFVESRYFGSPTNQAIIDNYVNYIIGNGLKAIEGISQEDLDTIISEEDLRCIITEYKMQGNSPIQVVYSKSRDRRVAKLHSIPAKNVAVVKQDDISEDIQQYWYCFDWYNRYKFTPYEVPAFGKGNDVEKETEIYYLKRYSPQPIFSLPDYVSGLQYCEVEEEMSNYYINHIRNNFSAGKVVNIYQGEAETEEAMDEAERLIKGRLAGSSNAGNVIVSFNANKDQKTTVENIEVIDAYKQFETLSKESRQKIMLSHKVNNPALFGFANPTGFSSNGDELEVSLNMLYRSQINPIRRVIIKALESILSINSEDIKIGFRDFNELLKE